MISIACRVVGHGIGGYMVLMAASAHSDEVERRETEIMIQRRIAGLLVTPVGSRNEHFTKARREGIPIVSFDRPLDRMDAIALLVDNRAAAIRVTEHLIEHGHRHILCLAEDEKIFTLTERASGYCEAMRRAGLQVRIGLVGSVSGSVCDQLNLALASVPAPTAIFATRNVITVEVLRELQKRSMRMPEEMALVGFDDFDAAALVRPRITVVRQPIAELGRTAATMLLARLKGNGQSAKRTFCCLPNWSSENPCGCLSRA